MKKNSESPHSQASFIIADLLAGDSHGRNNAILKLARSDPQTRRLVERQVAWEVEHYSGPEDDFSDWGALNREPFHFSEEPDDFLSTDNEI
jgi:hypothetical protein